MDPNQTGADHQTQDEADYLNSQPTHFAAWAVALFVALRAAVNVVD